MANNKQIHSENLTFFINKRINIVYLIKNMYICINTFCDKYR